MNVRKLIELLNACDQDAVVVCFDAEGQYIEAGRPHPIFLSPKDSLGYWRHNEDAPTVRCPVSAVRI